MYSRSCIDDIRWIESSLYQGPETAEKVFEREESYQGPHARRRSLTKHSNGNDTENSSQTVWFEVTYDSRLKKFVRKFFDPEEK